MLLKDFEPCEQVKEFVQLYRIVHLQFNAGETIPLKAYSPRPEHCLAFYPLDKETIEYSNSGKIIKNIPVVLYGQFTEVTNRLIGNNFLVLQIVFNPGSIYKLLGIPAYEFTNQYLEADLIFTKLVHEINEQLFFAKSYKEMIEIADIFVKNLIKNQKKESLMIDVLCKNMLYTSKSFKLTQLAKDSFYSKKQFERKFEERTGVSPKLFERIIKFDKAFRLKNLNPNDDWLKIAIECDYYDYQHLTKAYKDFTGLSPVKFHEIENNAPERKLGLTEIYTTLD